MNLELQVEEGDNTVIRSLGVVLPDGLMLISQSELIHMGMSCYKARTGPFGMKIVL